MKGQSDRLYFCTEAETDACLNVKVVHYIKTNSKRQLPADWANHRTQALRGEELRNIQVLKGELGMAYQPVAEHVNVLNTQTPDSMGNDIHDALAKLKKAVGGDVTDFVCERLQWSREEITERLFAEQVDAVALIIYNFEARNQAMIIGDQTGIGKGRIASSIIRYAKVQGLIPVYCTENAGLFSDNYRDLCDIGCGELVPFIVNSSASGQTNACIVTLDDDDKQVVVHRPITDKKVKDKNRDWVAELQDINDYKGPEKCYLAVSAKAVKPQTEMLAGLSKDAGYIALDSMITDTVFEKSAIWLRRLLKIHLKKTLNNMYAREYTRRFGHAKFEKIVVYNPSNANVVSTLLQTEGEKLFVMTNFNTNSYLTKGKYAANINAMTADLKYFDKIYVTENVIANVKNVKKLMNTGKVVQIQSEAFTIGKLLNGGVE